MDLDQAVRTQRRVGIQTTHDDLTELDLALQSLQTRGLVIPNFGKDDFPVPKLIAKLEPMIERLDTGLGMLQITRLSQEKYSKDQASTLFWGLGAYIGRPWEQNARRCSRRCTRYGPKFQ